MGGGFAYWVCYCVRTRRSGPSASADSRRIGSHAKALSTPRRREILCGWRLGVLLCAVAWNQLAVHSPTCHRPVQHSPYHSGNTPSGFRFGVPGRMPGGPFRLEAWITLARRPRGGLLPWGSGFGAARLRGGAPHFVRALICGPGRGASLRSGSEMRGGVSFSRAPVLPFSRNSRAPVAAGDLAVGVRLWAGGVAGRGASLRSGSEMRGGVPFSRAPVSRPLVAVGFAGFRAAGGQNCKEFRRWDRRDIVSDWVGRRVSSAARMSPPWTRGGSRPSWSGFPACSPPWERRRWSPGSGAPPRC